MIARGSPRHSHHGHAHSHGARGLRPRLRDRHRAQPRLRRGRGGYGLAAGSLALLADAGHNLGDVLGLALSWGAAVLGRRGPSGRFTYGLRSSSILAALANAMILLVVTGGIAWEALGGSSHPVAVDRRRVAWVAGVGIVVNGGDGAAVRPRPRPRPQSRSAFLHMAADALVTAGVVVAGIAIALTGLLWLDPAVSLVVSAVIVYGTWDLVKRRWAWRSTRCRKASTPPRCAPICWRCPGSRRCTICTSGA